jgi:hypothetical protein
LETIVKEGLVGAAELFAVQCSQSTLEKGVGLSKEAEEVEDMSCVVCVQDKGAETSSGAVETY